MDAGTDQNNRQHKTESLKGRKATREETDTAGVEISAAKNRKKYGAQETCIQKTEKIPKI